MASRDTTLLQIVKSQEKAKRQLNVLFDELEFMFTDLTAVRVMPNGKRDSFYGDAFELCSTIQNVYWLHISKWRNRWYALVKFTDGQYGYLRCNYENFWSTENALRFYVGNSHTELIQYAMKKHAYKIYRKRGTNDDASSSAP